ncbi:Zinc finger, C6HC-type [Artemisia annua]|uniref:RBR-type E3 ubiquitin transferase n=1 Tax=Artemisia annua TaxID=35608 RepID=A0A2U1KPH0_ARTAN|nr:Zinc finger, C6HC-type [Artemisia annua]
MDSDSDSEKGYVILKEDGLLNSDMDSEKSYIVLKEDDLLNSDSDSEKSYDVLKEDNLMSSDNEREKSYDVLKEDNLMNSESGSKKSYVILKEDDLIRRQLHIIHEVASLLKISIYDACILLLKYNWCVTDVYEAWLNDERKVCDDVGLLDVDHDVKFPKHDKRKVKCGICFDSVRFDKTANCGCDHIICKVCWRSYVSNAINEGPGCLTLKCPEPSCGAAVGPDMVNVLAKGKERKMYVKFWLRSYVESSKNIKWCPGLVCDYAVEFDDDFMTDTSSCYNATCDCKHVFCWKCMEEAHSPLDCKTVGKWVMKNMAEAENTSWILANTKPCPKCKRWIERCDGCMHMKCIQPCGFAFCWLCLAPWKGHNFRACIKGCKLISQERQYKLAKKATDTYTHYYERWAANEKYKKEALVDLHNFETVYLEKVSSRHCLPKIRLMFIIDAWLQIVECRRVLKWTYVYGYYIPIEEEDQKGFYEYNLGKAEDNLERLFLCAVMGLQTCIKYEFELEQFNSFSEELSGLTKVTHTCFQNLVTALENGLSEVASHEDVSKTQTSTGQGDAAGRLIKSFNCLNLQV